MRKWWVPNYQVHQRARKHIADLISKGEVIKDVEVLSTQALCSYGYAAYKLEYEDDREERLAQ